MFGVLVFNTLLLGVLGGFTWLTLLYLHQSDADPFLSPEMRAHLGALGVPFAEAPIPGWAIHQLFLHDPRGLKIEMTFWMGQEEGGAA